MTATRQLTPLAAAVLSLLRGEDGPLDLEAITGHLLAARRYGAYADLDPAGIGVRAVRGALASLLAAGRVACVGGAWRWTPVETATAARASERQGCLFGE